MVIEKNFRSHEARATGLCAYRAHADDNPAVVWCLSLVSQLSENVKSRTFLMIMLFFKFLWLNENILADL